MIVSKIISLLKCLKFYFWGFFLSGNGGATLDCEVKSHHITSTQIV